MMFATDPAKQKAAWEFMKFATGPVGATIMVKGTGYIPATLRGQRPDDAEGEFYAKNPNHRVASQQPPMTAGTPSRARTTSRSSRRSRTTCRR